MSQPQIVFLDRDTLPVLVHRPGTPHQWIEYPASSVAQAAERLGAATVAITNKVPITAEVLAAAPLLKLVAVAATGYNIVDLEACRARGVAVCNIRDYAIHGVAEHTLLLMLALSRQLPAYRADVLDGAWQRAPGFCHFGATMHDLAGRRLCLIGAGALGQATAHLARAFGMNVFFVERRGAAQVREGYLDFDTALASADIVSLHCPLTDDTRHLIDAAALARMKPGALLINTARGGLIDEAALLAALQAGRLGGAGLDVLHEEPPRRGNPLLDVSLPHLIVTPHVAWASQQTMQRLAAQLTENIDAFLKGEPRNLV
ncbi:D-2-hydroxyacid dehydrogenase [Chitiniphilus eburneus]|uniref:D-2-hydroxyacid dehydrogenase n=1 Tax=Chitiniphilus eburneus TaxID=2571148 RepID=A0A4U0PCG2_9NEIS|nr:D-2-hydroxyacid dehydrogenase [Chitiniphilus eburneus]TJZ65435.1 D-2-hydroxyacid dehydrogenase [Chitiniphilus eburneus]